VSLALRKILFYSLGLLIVYALQSAIIPVLTISQIRPDLFLILVVIISLREGRLAGMLSGFGIGLLNDLMLPGTLGLNALAKTFVGFIVHSFPGRGYQREPLLFGLLLLFGAFFHDFIFNTLYTFQTHWDVLAVIFRYALPTALYTAVVGTGIYFLLIKFLGK